MVFSILEQFSTVATPIYELRWLKLQGSRKKSELLLIFQNQIEELKRAQNPSTAHLRDILLDPAINLMFQRMKKEMDVCKDKLEQAQNDLAAWKFTPDGYGNTSNARLKDFKQCSD